MTNPLPGLKGSPIGEPEMTPPGSGADIGNTLSGLWQDGRTLIEVEFAYHQARLLYAVDRGKHIGMLLALCGGFAFCALLTAIVGILLALAPLIGPWGAMALVTFACLALALLTLMMAVRRSRDLKRNFIGMDDDQNGGQV